MREEQVKTYFIVSVECVQVLSKSGGVMTEAGEIVWLADNDNYHANTQRRCDATKFSVPPTLREIKAWDGHPWFFKFKAGTEKAYKVDERNILEQTMIKIVKGN